MSKHPFVPPIPKISAPSSENWHPTDEEREQIKNSDYYREQIARQKERHRALKNKRRSEWWKNNWIALLSLVFAIIAALPVIIQAIEAMLKWLG